MAALTDSLVAENIFVSIGGREIVKGATISVQRGEVTGLLGRNGSGKSTMLQAVFGTRHAPDITVHAGGIHVPQPYGRPGLINYLPQFPFMPNIRVRQAVAQFGLRPDTILSDFPELEPDLPLKFSILSGGSARLWSALIMLYADTRFTLLDEPFSHIMPLYNERIMAAITRIKVRKGIIITDHMYRNVLGTADRIYLVKDGKTLYIRNREDLVLHGYLNQGLLDD